MASVDLTRINSNIAALNTLNSLRDVNRNLALHQGRLASGKRINEAADDPAGLVLATKFGVRANALQQAMDNIGDAKNMLAVAEGGMTKINSILGKMRIKAEQAASETLGNTERNTIAQDLAQYAREIDDIVRQTTWNSQKLLNGRADFDFQSSADYTEFTTWSLGQSHDVVTLGDLAVTTSTSTAAEVADTSNILSSLSAGNTVHSGLAQLDTGTYTISFTLNAGTGADDIIQLLDGQGNPVDVRADGSTVDGATAQAVTFDYDSGAASTIDFGNGMQIVLPSGLSTAGTFTATVNYTNSADYSVTLSSAASARDYMNQVDKAIATVSKSISQVGALVDRLTFKEEALAVGKINTEAAYNRIMNADMAMEQLEAVKFSILQQTSTTMLAQTNTAPQSVLNLFR